MKIVPATSPEALQKTTPGPGPEPAAPFRQFLNDGADPKTIRRERAFGFSELGVLGAARAPVADQPVRTASRTPSGGAAEPASEAVSEPHATPAFAAVQTVGDRRVAAEAAPTPRGPPLQTSFRPTPPPAATATTPVRNLPNTEAISPVRHRPVARQAMHTPLPKRFSVVLTGENGAMQLIAGSPELDADARERLRRAAAELAAEFGVTLARLTLNGSAI